MKSILLSTILSSALFTPIIDQIKPNDEIPFIKESKTKSKRKIQLVILFDTSSSMDGLLNQAKSRLWEIVNESGALRYNGEVPYLRNCYV
jgi:Mg-chelatase subunit ChlD